MSDPRDRRSRFGNVHRNDPDLTPDVLGGVAEPGTSGGRERPPSRELVEARNLLLLGLETLGPQRQALTVIGAQAVFEMTRHRPDLPFTLTKDADTSLDPTFAIAPTSPDRPPSCARRPTSWPNGSTIAAEVVATG